MSTQINWTTWNVTKFRTPREDADPIGVFKIEEVARQAAAYDDESCEHEPNSAEEQAALDKRDAVTDTARLLIAAAPYLLTALRKLESYMNETEHETGVVMDYGVTLARAAITKATAQ